MWGEQGGFGFSRKFNTGVTPGGVLSPFISEPVEATVLDRFLDNAVTVPAPVLECTLQTCVSTSFADRVESLQMPILVVGGRRDPVFPPEAVAQLAQTLPCARGISLPCSPEVPMERPRELAHLIESVRLRPRSRLPRRRSLDCISPGVISLILLEVA
jgi:pimeloyl-ACP methyl ester carboxylesterase